MNPLVKALEDLIADIKSKPNDTRYATHIKKAQEALALYSQSKEGEEGLSKEEIAVIENMADETFAGSEAIMFAEWLRENNMRPSGFGGWVGEINTNLHGSSEIKLYRLFKKLERAKTKR